MWGLWRRRRRSGDEAPADESTATAARWFGWCRRGCHAGDSRRCRRGAVLLPFLGETRRPAEQPAPVATERPRRTSVSETPPPPTLQPDETEPAPRTTPPEEPAPDVEPSTGSDPVTVSTSGIDFQHPEYLRNIVAQVHRRWRRPEGNVSLRAEVQFFIHRDGSISNFQFLTRSGSFGFDLEAQGAIEAAANANAFGPLPEGYPADVLPVSFFFDPSKVR